MQQASQGAWQERSSMGSVAGAHGRRAQSMGWSFGRRRLGIRALCSAAARWHSCRPACVADRRHTQLHASTGSECTAGKCRTHSPACTSNVSAQAASALQASAPANPVHSPAPAHHCAAASSQGSGNSHTACRTWDDGQARLEADEVDEVQEQHDQHDGLRARTRSSSGGPECVM